MDDWLSKEQADTVEGFFNDFASKREEYGIVDAEAIYDDMLTGIKKGTVIVINGLGAIDIPAFADTVAQKIIEMGTGNVDWGQLNDQLKEQLTGITEEDLDRIIEEIKERVNQDESTSAEAGV